MSDPSPLPFLTRLWFAYVVFFRVLMNGQYAAELQVPKALPSGKEREPAMPAPRSATPEPDQARKHGGESEPDPSPALQFLALLQREGRLVDFLEEDVASFTDADIGAAARVVHSGCRKALRDHLKLEPVRSEEEGKRVTLSDPFSPAEIKLTGNVQGKGPHTGTLRHRGWRVAEITLPTAVQGHDARIVAQAEVEL